MKTFKKIISNEHGHGYIGIKDLLKIGAIIVTFPVSVPVLIIKDKIKKKKDK